jgi:hypothetical protein
MSTKPSNSDRRLRSHVSDDDINELVDDTSEVEFNIRTPAKDRSESESEDGGNETILNTDDDTNMDEQRGGGERIDLTNVNQQTVRADVTGDAERNRTAMRPQANAFVPAPAPPPASMDPTQMMMAMLVQFQEQARLDREQQREDRERARLDSLQLQREIAELRNARAPAPARPVHLRTGKPPQFDMDTDRNKFATWKSKWGYYIKSSGIADLSGTQKTETMRAELNLAMSDATISWLSNQTMTEVQREDSEFIINKLEDHIKGSTNPYVAISDMLKVDHTLHAPLQPFYSSIMEQLKMCDTKKMSNIDDMLQTLSVILNMKFPSAMTKILLEKDLTFQKCMDIGLAEEKAYRTAKLLNGGTDPYAAATSTYKADRNAGNQNRQGGNSKTEAVQTAEATTGHRGQTPVQ